MVSKREVDIDGTRVGVHFHVPTPNSGEDDTHDQNNRTIKVTGLPPDVDDEMLELKFENKRVGGGPIETLNYEQGSGTAYITFKESEGMCVKCIGIY